MNNNYKTSEQMNMCLDDMDFFQSEMDMAQRALDGTWEGDDNDVAFIRGVLTEKIESATRHKQELWEKILGYLKKCHDIDMAKEAEALCAAYKYSLQQYGSLYEQNKIYKQDGLTYLSGHIESRALGALKNIVNTKKRIDIFYDKLEKPDMSDSFDDIDESKCQYEFDTKKMSDKSCIDLLSAINNVNIIYPNNTEVAE